MRKQNDRPMAYGPDPWGGVPHRELVVIKAQQKDRPGREKITNIVVKNIHTVDVEFGGSGKIPMTNVDVGNIVFEIIAHIEPLIKDAKREEGKRIFREAEKRCHIHGKLKELKRECFQCWQALKEGS